MDLVAYVRVSKVGKREGDSFQSPRDQRRAIEAIVSLTPNARIVAEYEDLDESGGTMDRPGVRAAIEMVEAGQADGIVCAYLDRWARTVEALEMIEAWATQGRTFISARERFDATTSQGKFALGMMLLVAKYYRDLVTERWDSAVQDAVERGVHVSVPYGYRRSNGKGSPLVSKANEAVTVRRIFEERLRGVGIANIAHGLNGDAIPSPRGGLWTRQAVRALLRVRAYTGTAHSGDHELRDAHPAIVSATDWEACQRERPPAVRNGSMLGGLVRCAACGYVMGASDNGRGQRRYNCNRHHAEMRCPSPTTAPAETLEALVADAFLARYGQVRMRATDAHAPAITTTESTLERTRTEYERWRDDTEMRAAIGDEDYRAGLLARKRALDDSERAYADAVRNAQSASIAVDEDIWSSLDLAERRELIRSGLDAVVLRRADSTHTPLTDRVELVWAGELEHDGTRSGVAASVRSRSPNGAGILPGKDAGEGG